MNETASTVNEQPEVQPLDERALGQVVAGNAAAGNSTINTPQGSAKLIGEMLSNVSKTRSEISMTFARNARA